MNDETWPTHADRSRSWTHPDGTALLPIRKMGCYGCAGGSVGVGLHEGSLAKYRCSDIPNCAGIIWATDTPENRVAFIAQRMAS